MCYSTEQLFYIFVTDVKHIASKNTAIHVHILILNLSIYVNLPFNHFVGYGLDENPEKIIHRDSILLLFYHGLVIYGDF